MASKNHLEYLIERRKNLGNVGAIDFLISLEEKKLGISKYPTNYTPFKCSDIHLDSDLDKFKRPPKNFPQDLELPLLQGLGNDYSPLEKYLIQDPERSGTKVSIVVLTFNRAEPLSKTLAGIVRQSYPKELIEVIVTDDGGTEEAHTVVKEFANHLNIKYVWHKDIGFTPAIARNNGVNIAKNDFIILLDVDMLPSRNLVASYVRYEKIISKSILIGPRKYIAINELSHNDIINDHDIESRFNEIVTNNSVANKLSGAKSVDWRLDIFHKTNNLKTDKLAFRTVASGNVAFSKNVFNSIGKFDERFNAWGYEDTELGFRFFNDGKYVIPVLDAMAFHQEPFGGENETDRAAGKTISGELFGQICPYYRIQTSKKRDFEVPTVSIYIPTYNAENTICDAIDSALNQTYKDLEVCICDDGSTDSTPELLKKYFSNHPRVRWIRQSNGGIGKASNTATSMTKGIYIGQLDSDDYLAIDVVEKCVAVMENDMKIGLVYTSYENEYPDGRIEPGYNYPVFTREKMLTAMIVHHFRMFRRLYWARSMKFDERIKNAVDYDMYLKLTEICKVQHLNIRGYRRRLHGNNTSIVDFKQQMKNSAVVVSKSLARSGLPFQADLENENESKLLFSRQQKAF